MSTRMMPVDEARDMVTRILVANRTAPETAASVARALVAAEADGLKGHGLSRVASYAAQAKVGKIDGFARPILSRRAPGSLVIDAAHGFAYPALDLAVASIVPPARRQGIAIAAIRRSHHCGAMGLVVERLAEAGLTALMVANTPAAIAPWGGRRGLFGTNPIAFAAPLEGRAPVVVDLSLSKVARGNILAAKQRGEPIPEDWALDAEGRPTTEPQAALDGTMLPLGDAKGTALAFMVEMLAAGLTGATYAFDATSYLDAEGGPPATGQMIVAIDPRATGGSARHMLALAEAVEAEPGARLPGARRLEAREKALRDGVAVPEALISQTA